MICKIKYNKIRKKVLSKPLIIKERNYAKMKIQLPNGKQHELNIELSLEEKVKIVEELTNKWKNEIENNWNSNSVRFFLDSLSNYLVWHKDDINSKEEDKEVMSKNKTNRLHRGRKDIPFSNLSNRDKEDLLGEVRGAE